MTLWLLGGHDPTRGAGIHRDLVTARRIAPALPRRLAVTALTEQGGGRPATARPVPASRVRRRLQRWPAPSAVKVGLVPDELAEELARMLAPLDVPVVVDPVLRASDGGWLGASPEGLAPLLAVATVLTPNRAEARALVGEGSLPVDLGRRFPQAAVLLKDGHGDDPERVADRLIRGPRVISLSRPRQPGPDPRGTGCALATAIAVGLARGAGVEPAVREAVAWLDRQRIHWIVGPDGRAHLPDEEIEENRAEP